MATALHEIIVRRLLVWLDAWVTARHGQVFGSELKLAIAPRRGRKPDLSVFTTEQPNLDDAVVHARPFLVVEVLSPRPRDVRRDRLDKMRDYATLGAKNYSIVDPQLHTFEMLRLKAGEYVHATPVAEKPRPAGFPGLILDLPALWAEVDRVERASRRAKKR